MANDTQQEKGAPDGGARKRWGRWLGTGAAVTGLAVVGGLALLAGPLSHGAATGPNFPQRVLLAGDVPTPTPTDTPTPLPTDTPLPPPPPTATPAPPPPDVMTFANLTVVPKGDSPGVYFGAMDVHIAAANGQIDVRVDYCGAAPGAPGEQFLSGPADAQGTKHITWSFQPTCSRPIPLAISAAGDDGAGAQLTGSTSYVVN